MKKFTFGQFMMAGLLLGLTTIFIIENLQLSEEEKAARDEQWSKEYTKKKTEQRESLDRFFQDLRNQRETEIREYHGNAFKGIYHVELGVYDQSYVIRQTITKKGIKYKGEFHFNQFHKLRWSEGVKEGKNLITTTIQDKYKNVICYKVFNRQLNTTTYFSTQDGEIGESQYIATSLSFIEKQ